MRKIQSPITRIRNQKGWTIGELAEEIGAWAGILGRIERGTMRLPVAYLEKLISLGYDGMTILREQDLFIKSHGKSKNSRDTL